MKAWLKGGLIGAIVGLVLYLIVYLSSIIMGEGGMIFLVLIFPAVILWDLMPFNIGTTRYELYGFPFIILIHLIIWFIIGALIGLIVQKVKEKNG